MDPKELLQQAEKKASSTGGFFSKVFGGSAYQLEEAVELFVQAANGFKLAKDNAAAGRAFERAAEIQKRTDARDDASNTLVDSYKAYRQTNPEDAVRVLEEAVELFTLRGQFRRAANYEMDVGAVYETELNDPKKALAAYENAGDWYFNDQAEALSNKAFLKVADLAALTGELQRAITNYERVAKQSLNSSLSKWSLKEYFIKATFCYLAEGDSISTTNAMNRYVEWDPSFGTTKEFGFLQGLSEAVKAGDEQAFTDRLWEMDQFAKLDKWRVSMGLKIKEKLEAADDDDDLL